jgi:TolA-binding protein
VETYPQSSAAPAALLSLASALVARGASIVDARLLLEKVILEYPKSALVPQARRDLDRLLGRVPGG